MRRAAIATALLALGQLVATAETLNKAEAEIPRLLEGLARTAVPAAAALHEAGPGVEEARTEAKALAVPDARRDDIDERGPAADSAGAAAPPTARTEPAQESNGRGAAVPAKKLFGAAATPAPLAARSIGFYARGCLAGAVPVPIDGDVWQVMRLSRNRNWGHPNLVRLVERLAEDAMAKDGWPGLLVGDLSQPRGGPMLTGHNSHQIGLDADIWLTPMPDRRLSAAERESLAATSMLGKDGMHVDPEVFTPHHAALIRRAASYAVVERVLVHPGIKKAMCEEKGADRTHFHKVRPYWGHHYHMHIRIACPRDSVGCRPQAPTSTDDGCGSEIDDWMRLLAKPPKPEPPGLKPKPERPVTLVDLPPECSEVLAAGEGPASAASAAAGRPKGARAARSER